jgi:hypothetical protein
MKSLLVAGLLAGLVSVARAEPTQVVVGAELGGGTVNLFGSHHAAAMFDVDVAAARWVSPQLALGVRLGGGPSATFDPPHVDGHPVDRITNWILEPQLLARTTPTALGAARIGWLAIVGVGGTRVDTVELCGSGGHLFELHHSGGSCEILLASSHAFEGSASGGGYVELHHFTMMIGLRASANTAGDRALGLVVHLGATF